MGKGRLKFSERTLENTRWIHTHLKVPDGKLVGQPMVMSPAEMGWLERIYGSPTRRFILSIPRKNGKTCLSACLVLLHLCGPEAKKNSQLYSAARSRDQAAVLFELAAKMVRMSVDLGAYVVIRDTVKEMVCPELGNLYKALSADASTKFGLSPALTIHDELGQVKGPRDELYEALETATAAQGSPLTVIISTQAPTDADLLSILIDDALTGADPQTKCVVHSVPVDDDPFDMKVLAKAQPNWHLMNQEEVKSQADSAKRMPSREAAFRNLVANQRVEVRTPFISHSVWMENAGKPGEWEGQRVFGGLDLSSVSDLTALVLVTKRDGAFEVTPTFWLPEAGLVDKSRVDRVPYDTWCKQGYLMTSPGASIEYEFVAEHLRGIFDRCDVSFIAFDRYNMKFLKPWLERAGFKEKELDKFVEFGQGFQSMSPALREFESLLLSRKIRHGGHPVLTMCADNCVITTDPAGNRKLDKKKSNGRIDGMVALTMAIGASITVAEKTPSYQAMFF
jgi:phage terminase large subunit-like protein